jgi:CPA2 family monovalent cation:H+ antiporter-2
VATAPSILEIAVVLLAAAAAGWAARRVGLPAVLGYLFVGLAVSPFTPGYVVDRHQLEVLADFGVVLLLFEVGIEVDLFALGRDHRGLVWAAPTQTVVTTVLVAGVMTALGQPFLAAAILGLCVAMSSSVVIVNITRSRRRTTDRATEQALLGWSVLQDVTGVSLSLLLLAVASPGARPIGLAVLSIVAFLGVAIAGAWLLPRVLRRLRSEHDLFLIVSVASGLGLAGLGAVVFEVPMALAAFVAGLAVTESPDAAEARRRLLPFRDVFAVLFFVTIGMIIDPAALGAGLPWLALLLGLLLIGKTLVAYVLARLAGLHARPAQLAVGLSQIGEFSFVLVSILLVGGAIRADLHAAVLATVVVSIAASTVLVRVFPAPSEPHGDLQAA